jgi:hypothetical protein
MTLHRRIFNSCEFVPREFCYCHVCLRHLTFQVISLCCVCLCVMLISSVRLCFVNSLIVPSTDMIWDMWESKRSQRKMAHCIRISIVSEMMIVSLGTFSGCWLFWRLLLEVETGSTFHQGFALCHWEMLEWKVKDCYIGKSINSLFLQPSVGGGADVFNSFRACVHHVSSFGISNVSKS